MCYFVSFCQFGRWRRRKKAYLYAPNSTTCATFLRGAEKQNTNMKKILLCLAAVLAMAACQERGRFHVEGHITGAKDSMLYLDHITLGDGVKTIDSTKLGEDGHFRLGGDTIGNPEFYVLRIGERCINLAFDSTETVNVEASLDNMSFGYKVEGSGVCDTIKMLTLQLADLERQVLKVSQDRNYTLKERADMIDTLLEDYKETVKMDIIQNRYWTAYSYFACFQTLGDQQIFNPVQSRSDLTWMRAVANAWNEKYPGCPRSQNISNIVEQSRANHIKAKQLVINLDDERVSELGIIDMTFPDINGKDVTLSSLRGKVVLLDFTAFALKGSQERTLELRDLYNRYHSRGLEIYQVSLDPDRHFWTQRCEQLPWVSVYCEDGFNSDIVTLYQVNALPYYFLIDRNCDLYARMENIEDIKKAIEKLL